MLTTASRIALAVAAASLTLAALPASARLAADTTAPTLKAPLKASFVVGTQITSDANCFGDDEVKVLVHETFKWRGSDDSGSVLYDVLEKTRGEGNYRLVRDSSQTSFSMDYGTNWTNDCGGGSWHPIGWRVTAKDPAGNSTKRFVSGGLIGLTQDTHFVDSPYGAPSAFSKYSRAWKRSSCGCWSHGDTHKTTQKGASATSTVVVPSGSVSHIGLVMAAGPDRGAFKVFIDGVRDATVDTYAPSSQPRTIVWQSALGSGTHKVKIVNKATEGRPRIDLDAVLTN